MWISDRQQIKSSLYYVTCCMLVCNDLASNIMRTNCGIQKGGAGAASFRILDKIHKKDVPFFIATLLGVSDSVQYIHSANDLILYFKDPKGCSKPLCGWVLLKVQDFLQAPSRTQRAQIRGIYSGRKPLYVFWPNAPDPVRAPHALGTRRPCWRLVARNGGSWEKRNQPWARCEFETTTFIFKLLWVLDILGQGRIEYNVFVFLSTYNFEMIWYIALSSRYLLIINLVKNTRKGWPATSKHSCNVSSLSKPKNAIFYFVCARFITTFFLIISI